MVHARLSISLTKLQSKFVWKGDFAFIPRLFHQSYNFLTLFLTWDSLTLNLKQAQKETKIKTKVKHPLFFFSTIARNKPWLLLNLVNNTIQHEGCLNKSNKIIFIWNSKLSSQRTSQLLVTALAKGDGEGEGGGGDKIKETLDKFVLISVDFISRFYCY